MKKENILRFVCFIKKILKIEKDKDKDGDWGHWLIQSAKLSYFSSLKLWIDIN